MNQTLKQHQDAFLNYVIQARNMTGIDPTSFIRTPQANDAVGGDPESQHLLELAADWPLNGRGELAARIGEKAGYEVVTEADHYHVQAFPMGFLASCGFVFPVTP